MITATFLYVITILALILIIIATPAIIYICFKLHQINKKLKNISIDTKFLGDCKYEEFNE